MLKFVPAVSAAVLMAATLVIPPAAGAAEGPRFTAAQVQRGEKAYGEACALCHGADMAGGPGIPSLTGPDFAFGWKDKPTAELFDYVHKNMPPGQAGSLDEQQYLDIVAAILAKNGVTAGQEELKPGAPSLAAAPALR